MALLLSAVVKSSAQTAKKDMTVADYAKWSNLQGEAISPDGKWVTYKLQYDDGADTLFVQNTKSGKKYIFPSATSPEFSNDSRYITVQDSVNGLVIKDLDSDKLQTFKFAQQHNFCTSQKYLTILSNKEKISNLLIVDYARDKRYNFPNVSEYVINNNGSIAISTGNEVTIANPETKFVAKTIAKDNVGGFQNLQWSTNGEQLAFLQQSPKDSLVPANHKIHCYNLIKETTNMLSADTNSALSAQRITVKLSTPALQFSNDGKHLVFAMATPHKPFTDDKVEVWDSATPLEYIPNKYQGNLDYEPKLAKWSIDSGIVKPLGTITNPIVKLLLKSDHVLCYNPLLYEPQYEYYAPSDIYIRNTLSGEEELLLQHHSTMNGTLGASPDNKFINYFKDGAWYIYNIENKSHKNITGNLKETFHNNPRNLPGEPFPYGYAGWTADSKYFMVYDEYGIWLLAPDGKHAKKIIDGSSSKTRLRIYQQMYEKGDFINPNEFFTITYNLSEGLILTATNDQMATGYYKWSESKGVKKFAFNDNKIDRLQKAKSANSYIFVEQNAAMPPNLVLFDNTNPVSKIVKKSNPHADKYNWANTQLISYSDKSGKSLKAILYKPSNFIVGKKYPMVVLIYEKQSKDIHNYNNPTEYDAAGFAPSNYFLDGYLVLMPDISYEVGDPGLSALDCVETAVNAVKREGIVDENNIGIIGHSFGGYEVAFIITHSNMFKTAVAGAGVMNLLECYFTYKSVIPRSNTWRFEEQQFRMGTSPFGAWDAYQRNSPINYAANISTPLLSWAGKDDSSVAWTQSAEFHLALRRLNKRNVFLVYNGEGHTISDVDLQKDLTKRTKNWFDFYLKDDAAALVNGIP